MHVCEPPREGGSEMLTHAEIKYLYRRNWLRLMQRLAFFGWVGFVFFALLLLSWLAFKLWDDSWVLGLLMAAACSFVWFLMWLSWGEGIRQAWGMSGWLSLDDVDVLELNGQLGVAHHPTDSIDNVWMLDDKIIDIPEHWLLFIDNASLVPNQFKCATFRVAKTSKATGALARLVMVMRYSVTRVDVVMTDPQYIILQAGSRSVEEDYQRNIPINRNNTLFVVVGIGLLLLSLFCAITWSVLSDDWQRKMDALGEQVASSQRELGLERPITLDELESRDLPLLSFHKKYRALVGEPMDYVVLAMRGDAHKVPLLLSVDEYRLINRLVTISPDISLGYHSSATSRDIRDYRNKLFAFIDSSTAISQPLRDRAAASIQAMSDVVIENQIRSYGNGFVSSVGFVNALLPRPEIRLPLSQRKTPHCIGRSIFCSFNAVTIKSLRQNSLFKSQRQDSPLFSVRNGHIYLYDIHYANSLSAHEAELERFHKRSNSSIWVGLAAIISFSAACVLLISFWLARRRAKRWAMQC